MRAPHTKKRKADEEIVVAGLTAGAEINTDTWGIPHIRAENMRDLFFVQGFNAARDRLWQIDLWRKRGLGLLAADFGPGYLAQDRATRLFLYRGDMAAEWACYGPEAEDICTTFTDGINAYVDLVAAEPHRLPPEYSIVGTRPAKWCPEDVVRIRTHAWVRNALSEVIRANVMAKAQGSFDLFRQNLEPPTEPHVAEGLDLAAIPLSVLDVYKLAFAPVTFSRERLDASLEDAWTWTKVTPLGEVVQDAGRQGSNNWAISGTRTASGRPILANDPHRLHALPAIRYLVHLTAPGFDAIGTGEPILPGIMIGHNGDVAFGLTLFFGPDQEDVYVYETKPGATESYRYKGGWEAMEVIEQAFAVKGAADQTLQLKFTRHGPVICEDPEARTAFAVRTIFSEPGSAPYGASLLSMKARNLNSFREAMRLWSVPTVNQVYADTSGNIAWVVAGFSPIRENWDGLLPVPGDGRYEWKGFYKAGDLPSLHNPDIGYVASANEMNLPPDWPHEERRIGHEWLERSRSDRIKEVFGENRPETVETSRALQTDTVSLSARRVTAVLAGLKTDDADAKNALALLRDWDHSLAAESAPAALYELWWSNHLKPALFARVLPDPTLIPLMAPGDAETVVQALEQPQRWFGSDATAAREMLLVETLSAAFRDAVSRMGADSSAWAWGRLHKGHFVHPLGALDPSGALREIGPLSMGGSDTVTMNATYRPNDFRVTLGASARLVFDVGAWDNSVCINAPGQSGVPESRHYDDLAPLWAKGDYVPLLYSADAVDRATQRRIILIPVSRSRP